jgi:hypothetical protein
VTLRWPIAGLSSPPADLADRYKWSIELPPEPQPPTDPNMYHGAELQVLDANQRVIASSRNALAIEAARRLLGQPHFWIVYPIAK